MLAHTRQRKKDSPMQIQEWSPTHPLNLSDGLLAQQALAGDQNAFSILVHRYTSPLYSYICHVLHDTDEAQDILQQVFLKLYLSLPTLHTDQPLKPWLFHVTRNRCLDALRRKSVLRFSELEAVTDEEGISLLNLFLDPRPSPEERAEQREVQQALQQALLTLKPKARSIVLLRYAGQLSFSEIAQVLHIPVTTVKTYVRRAKPHLRTALAASLRA